MPCGFLQGVGLIGLLPVFTGCVMAVHADLRRLPPLIFGADVKCCGTEAYGRRCEKPPVAL